MEIKYLGHSCFFIKSDNSKLVADPFDPQLTGMKFPKTEADTVTISHHHKDHDQSSQVAAPENGIAPLIIDMPGEFEKMGFRIFGHRSYHDKKKGEERGENIMYKIEAESINVLHCGDLGYIPDDSFIDSIGDVDVLLVPVGGFYTIDANEAAELVKKIEPSIVIPMHFNHDKLNQSNFGSLIPVTEFLKKFGAENIQPVPKLVLKGSEFNEEMKIVLLEIS